jgi:hypothetical protein
MNQQTFDDRLRAIGVHALRVMALQACARVTGSISLQEVNQAAAEMTLATRLAGKTLRELTADKDELSIVQASFILHGCPECVKGVINHISDGHLALSFIEPTGL